jgi:hypothetical protein
MRVVTAMASIGLLVMVGALVYGFGWGNGWAEVAELMDFPWFVVSLFDVYVGFALFAAWIAWRERPLAAVIWIILLMTLGNAIACFYALLAALRSRPDWQTFWMGPHRTKAQPAT